MPRFWLSRCYRAFIFIEMKIRETKEVTEKRVVTIGYKCDNCGKIHNGDFPEDWHEFSGHHNSWGNDSCDSYEYYMACSPECFAKLLQQAVKEFENYDDAEINGYQIEFAKRMVSFLNAL